MWQFTEAVRGLADGCLALGIPVTGGNVSFYNQTKDAAIQPTPVIGVLGVHADVRRRVPSVFTEGGTTVLLLGGDGADAELGGSLWAHVVHGHLGGSPPAVDLPAERALAQVLATAAERGLLRTAHDLSDGGLAVALAEACLGGRTGVLASVPDGLDEFGFLFGESAARALVAVAPGSEDELAGLCAEHGVPATVLGRVGGTELTVAGFSVSLGDLAAAHRGTLPALFG
jgi:phosphoribosylformylglycinamidine synthase